MKHNIDNIDIMYNIQILFPVSKFSIFHFIFNKFAF